MATVTPGVKEVTCPFCSARYRVPDTVYYSTCPYCGTTFKLSSPEEAVEHYLFKLRFEAGDAYKKVKSFASLLVGAAKDIDESSYLSGAKLYYIPLYIYEVDVKVFCNDLDKPPGGEDFRYVVYPAVSKPPIPIPEGYNFPARGREFFKPSVLKNGVYLQPELNPMDILERVKKTSLEEAFREARSACPGERLRLMDESRYLGIHHYPFWMIKYVYRGREYKAYIDGVDGTILYLEYPVDLKRGLTASLLFIGGLLASGGLSSILAMLMGGGNPLVAFILGASIYAPAAAYGVKRVAGFKKIYRFNPREEESFLPIR